MARDSQTRTLDRDIRRLALPSLGELASEPLYLLVDTAIIGHLGTVALGGVAVAATTFLTGWSMLIVLAYGTTAAVSRAFGAGDSRRATGLAVQAVIAALGIAVVLGLAGLAFADPLLRAIGADAETIGPAHTYFVVSLAGLPALLCMLVGVGYLRGLQNARVPFAVAVGTNIANIGLELLLVYGLHLGVGGSALATVIVQWAAAGVYLTIIAAAARRDRVALRPVPSELRTFASTSGALFVRTAALRFALTLMIIVVAGLGTVQLAATQIATQLWTLLALTLDAIAIAAQALTGRMLGAGDAATVRRYTHRMLVWGVWAGLALLVLVLVLRPWLPSVFTPDVAVQSTLATLLVIVAVFQPVASLVFVLDGVLIGAGDHRYLAVVAVAADVLFVPTLIVLAGAYGVTGAWWALGVLTATRLLVNAVRYRSDSWLRTGARLPMA